MSELFVYWGSTLVGCLTEGRQGLVFAYERPDSPMISVAMPPRRQPYGDSIARPFFRGLLPEGEARLIIAYDLGLGNEGGTDVEMLAALGMDCAGALVITEDGAPPASVGSAPPAPLREEEVAVKLRALPNEPLGVTGDVRVSLTGMQPKLPLARLPDGSWALSSAGRPSTHILKPPSAALADSVPNEVFCMRLAGSLGVNAAPTDLVSVGDLPVLVSTRYDRSTDPDGTVSRFHQEDGCQALSIAVGSPRAKYQRADGTGPSLAGIAALLDQWAPVEARYELLDHILVTVAVGNADLHGRNVSLLHRAGQVQLAPMYDIMSTVDLSVVGGQVVSSTLGMHIGGKTDVHDVGVEDLLREAERWGLRRGAAEKRVHELIDRLPGAVDDAVAAVPTVPEERLETIRRRVEKLQSEALGLLDPGAHVDVAEHADTGGSSGIGQVRSYVREDGTPVRAHTRRRT